MKKNRTIKNLAKKIGVHHSTIYRALNDSDLIGNKTKKRIKNLAKKFGYQRNLLAKSLFSKKSYTVGLIVGDISAPFFAEVAKGVEDTVRMKGYNVFVCNTDDKIQQEKIHWQALSERQVDGIILSPSLLKRDYILNMVKSGVPLVLFDRCIKGLKTNYVIVDNLNGAYQAVKHLINLGHKRIACIRGLLDMGRLRGYKKALQEHEIEFDPGLVVKSNWRIDGGYRATKQLLNIKKQPTAIFAANDLVALGSIMALREFNLKVPQDMALVGFDNMEFSKFIDPPLTTVAQPAYEIGVTAANILINEMEGNKKNGSQVVLKTQLIVRKSTTESGAGLKLLSHPQ